MANPRWGSHTNEFEAAIWAAKIALSFIVVLTLGASSRAVVPVIGEAMAFALPGFSASLCSWLAPPYLFVAINLIVLVLWKLAYEKQQHNHRHLPQQWKSEERMAEFSNPAKVLSFEPSHSANLLRKPSPEIGPDEISPSPSSEAVLSPDSGAPSSPDSSSLTTESGERSTASTAFAAKRSAEPESKSNITVAEEKKSMAPTAAVMEDALIDLKATWKSITEKPSRPALAPLPADAASTERDERRPVAPPLPAAASHDELNQRFEDFIRKNREQIRLQNRRRR